MVQPCVILSKAHKFLKKIRGRFIRSKRQQIHVIRLFNRINAKWRREKYKTERPVQ